MLIAPTSKERYRASPETVLIRPAIAAKSQGVQPGAKLREKPPVSQRNALNAVTPKNCMAMSVRKAPMRRVAKRAEKSATPQPRAADIPRMISKSVLQQRELSLFRELEAENRHHLLQILPDFSLRRRIAQQVRRVISGDQFRAAKIKPLAAEAGDSLGGLKHGLRRATAEAADHLGSDRAELAKQVRRACNDLVLFRQTVFRRPAFDDVADVHVLSAKAHRLDHLREKFSGSADKRLTLGIFVAAGAFADKHKLCFRIADAEDNLGPRLVQLAPGAIRSDIVADSLKCVALDVLLKQRRASDRRNEDGFG